MYAGFLLSVGRIEESHGHFRRVRHMRPSSRFGLAGEALSLYILGRHEDARQVATEGLRLWPDHRQLKFIQVRASFWTKRYDDGLAVLDDPTFKIPQTQRTAWRAALQALKADDSRKRAQALGTLVALSERASTNSPVGIAAMAALGGHSEALAAAQRAIRDNGPDTAFVLFEPTFAPVRRTQQFAAVTGRLGLTRYWAGSGTQPDLCEAGENSPVCRRA